jgi:hypothetical protein
MKRALAVWRRVRPSGLIAFLVLAAMGCDTKTYQIDLRPTGDKIQRRLTVSRRNNDLADPDRPEVVRIARAYGVPTPRLPAKRLSLTGTFSNALPKDLGGDGHFVHFDSPFGCVRVYVERFRGNDDVQAALEARRKAVDQLVGLLIGWFDSELHGTPDWPGLRNFLDTQFRRDLQNLSLDAWAFSIALMSESKASCSEIAFRAVQYLVERGYFSYEETPALNRALNDAFKRHDFAALSSKIQRLLVARAGNGAGKLANSLGFLSDDRAVASWRRYFKQTSYFKQHKDDPLHIKWQDPASHNDSLWQAETKANPAKAGPAAKATTTDTIDVADHVLFDLLWSAFLYVDPRMIFEQNRLELSLAVPREPFWTNGKWSAADRRVVWSQNIASLVDSSDPQNWEWPTVCFAAWDEPNEKAQTRLLGTVNLTGEDLLQYGLWYEGLTAQEKPEWDAFLSTAKNDQREFRSLYEFRFTNEPTKRQPTERLAFPGADLIVNAFAARKP